jgi:hypothetical protein
MAGGPHSHVDRAGGFSAPNGSYSKISEVKKSCGREAAALLMSAVVQIAGRQAPDAMGQKRTPHSSLLQRTELVREVHNVPGRG